MDQSRKSYIRPCENFKKEYQQSNIEIIGMIVFHNYHASLLREFPCRNGFKRVISLFVYLQSKAINHVPKDIPVILSK